MIEDSYYQEIFKNLEQVTTVKWIRIPTDRPDKEKLISAIKKRIDMYNDFIFSDDYTTFKRVVPYKDQFDIQESGLHTELHFFKEEEVPAYDITKYNLPILIKAPSGKRR